MTDEELEIVSALSDCTFWPGTSAKRFVRSMRSVAETDPDRLLTTRQRRYLFGLRWKFRRQIPPAIAGLAMSLAEYEAHRRRKAAGEHLAERRAAGGGVQDRQPDLFGGAS